MTEQQFVPGVPIDPTAPFVVNVFHDEWLQYYPEIKEVVTDQPTWEGKLFIVYPAHEQGVKRSLLNMLMATTNDETVTVKNYPHAVRDEKNKLIAVVVHQVTTSMMPYDGLYTYRMLVR